MGHPHGSDRVRGSFLEYINIPNADSTYATFLTKVTSESPGLRLTVTFADRYGVEAQRYSTMEAWAINCTTDNLKCKGISGGGCEFPNGIYMQRLILYIGRSSWGLIHIVIADVKTVEGYHKNRVEKMSFFRLPVPSEPR